MTTIPPEIDQQLQRIESEGGIVSPNAAYTSQPIPWPHITEHDRTAVEMQLRSGDLSGRMTIAALETHWASLYDVSPDCVVAVQSCTAGLHLAFEALGLKREGPFSSAGLVLTTPYSFVGSIMGLLYSGLHPVFTDIDMRTLNMDIRGFQRHTTIKPCAILPVHIHGTPCDMDAVMQAANEWDVPVIEDCCQAHLSTYKGQMVGTFGDVAVFSFSVPKPMTSGQGGIIMTRDPEVAKRIRVLMNYGEIPSQFGREYVSVVSGFNYQMYGMEAALALSQLRRLPNYIELARRNALLLHDGLSDLIDVPNQIPYDFESSWHKYPIVMQGIQQYQNAFLEAGAIVSRWQTVLLPQQPFLKGNEDPVYGEKARWFIKNHLMVGSERYPLCVQPVEVIHQWIQAIRKVLLKNVSLNDLLSSHPTKE